MKPSRFVATVLFTDIVGSTERAAELGDARWNDLLRAHHALARREIARFHGREVNTTGDGFLATFDAPERALRCACVVRAQLGQMGLQIRAGLHTGEVETAEDDVAGIAVHVAARVVAAAAAGEILVSSTTRDLAAGSGYEFEDRGTHALKGVPGEWHLFAVGSEPVSVHAAGRWARTRASGPPRALVGGVVILALLAAAGLYLVLRDREERPGPPLAIAGTAAPGVAVLPFDVRGQEIEVWREGMVDLLSTNLDGTAGLRAIDSRTVLARWREAAQGSVAPDLTTALEVARRAGAEYAIVGNVASSGSGMRLRADVYELSKGTRLGEAQVEGSADSLFALVDRLSIEVLGAIWQGAGEPGATPDVARVTTTSLPALKSYLEGESRLRRSDFQGAIAAYRRALATDSTFAFAHARLADAYGWTRGFEDDVVPEWKRAARHAARLPEREALLLRAVGALSNADLDGLELVREAVRKYPDDADAWYLLGDFLFHLGEAALAGPLESDPAFEKAVELEPEFAPFYLHLIHNAFLFHADSARATRWISAYERVAADGGFHAENRIAFGLAFGDAAGRRAASTALDTLSVSVLNQIAFNYLDHPRFWEEQQAVLETRPQSRSPEGQVAVTVLWTNAVNRGKLQAARALLDHPTVPPLVEGAAPFALHEVGLPVRTSEIDHVIELRSPGEQAAEDSLPPSVLFYVGAYAADRGRWEDHADMAARIRVAAEQSLTAGDSAVSRYIEALHTALEAHGIRRRGDPQRALSLLQESQPEVMGGGARAQLANETVRWWIGELLLEAGRPAEAARYFESFWNETVARDRLARIYEELGEYGKAREAYEFVTLAWKDADPELQPRVVEAREALKRLTSVVRE